MQTTIFSLPIKFEVYRARATQVADTATGIVGTRVRPWHNATYGFDLIVGKGRFIPKPTPITREHLSWMITLLRYEMAAPLLVDGIRYLVFVHGDTLTELRETPRDAIEVEFGILSASRGLYTSGTPVLVPVPGWRVLIAIATND